jgi:60 kDa SS-A/Ro ribonucleoprotein
MTTPRHGDVHHNRSRKEGAMRLNVFARRAARTHEGAPAVPRLPSEQRLRRSVLSCLLWEGEFYEDGQSIAARIVAAAEQVAPAALAALAIEAREVLNLRHAPLLLLEVLSRTGQGDKLVADTVARVVQRADELGELIALHHKLGGKRMLPAQMRKGLARALAKFDAYALAKYDRDTAVKLRDVLRLVRPTPKDAEQSALWKGVKDRTLQAPDTWEVALSSGADKKQTFERLLRDGKLGYLALLRNLRNMAQAGVDVELVRQAIVARKGAHRVLPFRYVAAARAAPQLEPAIDQALQAAISRLQPLPGKTIVLIDVSGSMDHRLSGKSDMKRIDAAAALGAIVPGDIRLFTFSNDLVEVPPRRGMAGVDAIVRSQPHGGTYLGGALDKIYKLPHDRLIVVTDEQSHDRVAEPAAKRSYMINVGSYKNGVGYGRWTHIDGFSEAVIRFIAEVENVD